MKRAMGERKDSVGVVLGLDGGDGGRCGSQLARLKDCGWWVWGLGDAGTEIRFEKRPPRTMGRFWEGLRWPWKKWKFCGFGGGDCGGISTLFLFLTP